MEIFLLIISFLLFLRLIFLARISKYTFMLNERFDVLLEHLDPELIGK